MNSKIEKLQEAVDNFMLHQVTGTRPAMTALQNLVDAADACTAEDKDATIADAVAAERVRCAKACLRPAGWLNASQQKVVDEIRARIEMPT